LEEKAVIYPAQHVVIEAQHQDTWQLTNYRYVSLMSRGQDSNMRAIYVAFDQLNMKYGLLKEADPKETEILLVESQRMLKSRKWHFQRLFFLISAARHFAQRFRR
jgi:hypothetical protein